MKRIRIGKDISMRWEITTDGVAIPLEGRDLTVEIKSPMGIENNIPYRVDGNILIMTYYGYEQKRTGEYSITLWEKKGKPGQNVVDVIRAFKLVETSQEEDDFVGGDLQIESVDLGTENFDILTEGGYRAINIDTLQAEALEDSVNIKGKTYSNESFIITLPKANLDSAGVIGASDVRTLKEHADSIAQIKTSCEKNASDISVISDEVDTLKSQADTNTSNISSLNTEVSAMQSKVDENTTSISRINTELDNKNDEIAQINSTLAEHTESINAKITTDRISDSAVTSEKIATSAFDDTLSVSGKIAPADVVGGKLTELERILNDITDIPVLEVKGGFSVNATNGTYVKSNLNNVYEFDVVNFRSEKIYYTREVRPTDGNNGIAFFKGNNAYISGEKTKTDPSVSSSENAFEVSGVLVPSNASTMRVTFYANKEDELKCFFTSSRLDKLDENVAHNAEFIKNFGSIVESKSFQISSLDILETDKLPSVSECIQGESVVFKQVSSRKNTMSLDVEGLKSISYPLFVSTSGLGSCFVDKNRKFLSGFSNSTEKEGTLKTIEVPVGAKYFYYAGTAEGEITSVSELQKIKESLESVQVDIGKASEAIAKTEDVSYLEDVSLGYYDLSIPIGSYIDINTKKSSKVTSSVCVKCKVGDTYLVSGRGGASSRLWGILDAEKKLVSSAVTDLVTDEPIAIQIKQDGYIIYQSALGIVADIFCKVGEFTKIKEAIKSLAHTSPTPFAEVKFENGLVLACERRVIDSNKPVFYSGYLFYKWGQISKLYYGNNLDDVQEVANVSFDVTDKMMAMSPRDGRVIAVKRGKRDGIYIYDGITTSFLSFDSLSQKPMGWLYNSGVEFDIDENGTEICLFAEYTSVPTTSGGYHVWRGTYPYNSESLWEDVMFVPYLGDNPTLGVTHLHQIRRDPWTGILYLTSGDDSAYSRWWYSKDHGLSLIHI